MNITYITCFTIVLIRIVNLNHNEMLFLIKKNKDFYDTMFSLLSNDDIHIYTIYHSRKTRSNRETKDKPGIIRIIIDVNKM
jgi:hypothetical protein